MSGVLQQVWLARRAYLDAYCAALGGAIMGLGISTLLKVQGNLVLFCIYACALGWGVLAARDVRLTLRVRVKAGYPPAFWFRTVAITALAVVTAPWLLLGVVALLALATGGAAALNPLLFEGMAVFAVFLLVVAEGGSQFVERKAAHTFFARKELA